MSDTKLAKLTYEFEKLQLKVEQQTRLLDLLKDLVHDMDKRIFNMELKLQKINK